MIFGIQFLYLLLQDSALVIIFVGMLSFEIVLRDPDLIINDYQVRLIVLDYQVKLENIYSEHIEFIDVEIREPIASCWTLHHDFTLTHHLTYFLNANQMHLTFKALFDHLSLPVRSNLRKYQ